MGILPLEFEHGQTRESLGLTGEEVFDITGIREKLTIGKKLTVSAKKNGSEKKLTVICRIDTPAELSYYQHGGILQYVLRQLLNRKSNFSS